MCLTTSVRYHFTVLCVLSVPFHNEKVAEKDGEIVELKAKNAQLVSTKIVSESPHYNYVVNISSESATTLDS